MLEYRKSCGFVVFKKIQNEIFYLIIRAWNGEYGFPKGHVENNEIKGVLQKAHKFIEKFYCNQ